MQQHKTGGIESKFEQTSRSQFAMFQTAIILPDPQQRPADTEGQNGGKRRGDGFMRNAGKNLMQGTPFESPAKAAIHSPAVQACPQARPFLLGEKNAQRGDFFLRYGHNSPARESTWYALRLMDEEKVS